ncbi:hypothetical protein DO97_06885 [Neosynechococcus sphagnicola sy1]|uniref:Uncharacterized protein n=2 Tax=Neosynechococcus TaxID=1501143 RepID=A0A098TK14_9CYAN|nr:hypothetical protein DO97_06885 [Neosynechococcus sphagnicola sy1]
MLTLLTHAEAVPLSQSQVCLCTTAPLNLGIPGTNSLSRRTDGLRPTFGHRYPSRFTWSR